MQQRLQNKQKLINAWDWVLIAGLTFSPMNEFRIWKVGPGEALCFLWVIRNVSLMLKQPLTNPLVKFWLLFLPVITIGAAYGTFFYPKETSMKGIFTYVYFLVLSLGIYSGMSQKTSAQIKRFIYVFAVVGTAWYFFLYEYSLTVSRFFFGAHLWYGGVRFSGGANNPHQIAVMICVILFCNAIHVADPTVKLKGKLLPAVCVCACFFLGMKTKSSSLLASVALTMMFFIYYLALRRFPERKQRWIITSVLIAVVAIFVGIFREWLYDKIYDWIASDDNGLGRLTIFSSISITLRKSLFFGLGPGTHGMDGTIEYHNAYLEILAMGGVIGFALFLQFSLEMFRRLYVEPALLFCVIPIYGYAMGGFAMRRLIFWGITAILIAYAEKLNEGKKTPGKQADAIPVQRVRSFRSTVTDT